MKLKWKQRKNGDWVAGPFKIRVLKSGIVRLDPGLPFWPVEGWWAKTERGAINAAKRAAEKLAARVVAATEAG